MLWFIVVMSVIFLLLFVAICIVDRILIREKKDPEYHEKMERIRKKWSKFDPFTKFLYNAFWWAVILLFVYYIYL